MVSSQSTRSKEDPLSSSSSSYSPNSLDSSARSARPLFGVKSLLKPLKPLLEGRPSGRRPQVGSKFSRSGWDDGDAEDGVSGREVGGEDFRVECLVELEPEVDGVLREGKGLINDLRRPISGILGA